MNCDGKKCPKKNKKDVHKTYIDLQNCVRGIAMEIRFPKKIKRYVYTFTFYIPKL